MNEVLVIFDAEVASSGCADDAHGNGFAHAERITNGEREIAHLNLRRVADGQRRQVGCVDSKHRDVCFRIRADDARLELALVRESDLNFGRAIDHVIVGENIAVRAYDHARAETLLAALTRNSELTSEFIPEELAEKRVHRHFAPSRRSNHSRRRNVHYRRQRFFHRRSETVAAGSLVGVRQLERGRRIFRPEFMRCAESAKPSQCQPDCKNGRKRPRLLPEV